MQLNTGFGESAVPVAVSGIVGIRWAPQLYRATVAAWNTGRAAGGRRSASAIREGFPSPLTTRMPSFGARRSSVTVGDRGQPGMSVALCSFRGMSFAMMPYVVDLDVLHGSIGSKDVKLRRMIGGRFKQPLAHFDSQFDDLIEDGGPPIYEAIRVVIDGGPFDERYSVMYNYAYKWICEFHGRHLVNADFSPMRAGWLEVVDKGLADLGVTEVRVGDLGMGTAPSPIPISFEGHPHYGEWTLEECEKALEEWEQVTEDHKVAIDPYVLKAAESSMSWCETAVTAGWGVAAFSH